MLCMNRPEGFVSTLLRRSSEECNMLTNTQGPHSTLSSPIPTTCFVDVILVPLPAWVALLLLPALFILSIHHRKSNFNPSTLHLRSRPTRNCAFRITSAIYYILIICNTLMQTLEIVRLALIYFGIGLLPFAYIGLIIGALFHWSEGVKGRVRGWQAVNGVIWVGGVVI